MKLVLQRVSQASVKIGEEVISKIGKGLLILFGVSNQDDGSQIEWLVKKVSEMRIFPDEQGKMNLSVQDVAGEIMLVSQFTLYAACQKGRRPDFNLSAPPQIAKEMYLQFGKALSKRGLAVKYGRFGEMMEVQLCNDGPVTIILEK